MVEDEKFMDAQKMHYHGEWANGNPEGYGVAVYDDGSVYEGIWVDGKKKGKGRMTYK